MLRADYSSEVTLPRAAYPTLAEGLIGLFPHIGAAVWQQRFARGAIRDLNDEALPADTPYRAGARVRYFREVADEAPIPGEVRVIYRDNHLLVADKPHLLPVAPTGRLVEQTLLRRLQRELDEPALAPLHRLDRQTAGLVLVSVNPKTRALYHGLFRDRAIDKVYHALAPARPELDFPRTVRSLLNRGEPFFRMQAVAGEPNSETSISVLSKHGPLWRYELRPVTGRKHQLRVHMASLGAPIEGDELYPALSPSLSRARASDTPLRLLAWSLQFIDPPSGRRLRFETTRDLDPCAREA